MGYENYIPQSIRSRYEVHDYKHAAAILANEFPGEFNEIIQVLEEFKITKENISNKGGNESQIPKNISAILRPHGWNEGQLKARLLVDEEEINFDTHKIDYVKGRVAFDLEWNSKDQTYDRDLYAFRAFWDYNKISVGVLLTRGESLNDLFQAYGKDIKKKYGASTTWIGKLLPRLSAGRNGGCPVLVFGITPDIVEGGRNAIAEAAKDTVFKSEETLSDDITLDAEEVFTREKLQESPDTGKY